MSEYVAVTVGHHSISDIPVSSRQKTLRSVRSESSVAVIFNGERKLLPAIVDTLNDGKKSLPLLAECRICQEEDKICNLEAPCACSGSLKFAHHKCVQQWCNEKGDTVCEICQKSYSGNYTVPNSFRDNVSISMGGDWNIARSQQFDFRDQHHLLVSTASPFIDPDYEEYSRANARTAACFRFIALLTMVLLVLRNLLSITGSGTGEEISTFFMLFVFRAACFLLPCYIMVQAISVLYCRHQREEAALAAAQMTYLFQVGHAPE